MKKILLSLSLFIMGNCVIAQTLYTNTTETGSRFNAGLGQSSTPKVSFDDILIPSLQLAGKDSLRITKINFGIRRAATAPATSVNFFYTLKDDTATQYNSLIKIPPVSLGTVNLPAANGAGFFTQIASLGDSVNTLFQIKIDTGNVYSNFFTFFLGASLSNPDNNNGLRIVSNINPNDAGAFWIYNADSTVKRNATSFGASAPATFYIQVFGYATEASLPVKLITFTGKIAGEDAILNWSTASEETNAGFEIQRSYDGSDFVTAGNIAGSGNSNTTKNYQFVDKKIASGNIYYRLKQIDKDGHFEYSSVVKLTKIEKIPFEVTVINPSRGRVDLQIHSESVEKIDLNLFNLNGQKIASKNAMIQKGRNSLSIGQNLINGGYIVTVNRDGKATSYKVMIY